MYKGFLWTTGAGRAYQPAKVPAMWRRVADRQDDPSGLERDFGDPAAMNSAPKTVGSPSIANRVHKQLYPDPPPSWSTIAAGLSRVADLWVDGGTGIHSLPDDLALPRAPAVELVELELRRCAAGQDFRVIVDGLAIAAEPVTLRGYLWLSAAEAVRIRTRFRRCDRCTLWFPVKRTDAQFCSPVCRNYREKG